MNILIIEDEPFSAQSLISEVRRIEPESMIEGPAGSVKESRERLLKLPVPDLVLCDIQLSDGIAFDIFKDDLPAVPVIFITAFNEFALRAFKLNSIDYLLKPVDPVELADAFLKFKRLHAKFGNADFMDQFRRFFGQFPQVQPYKERLAVHEGRTVVLIRTADIVYFQKLNDVICVTDSTGKEFVCDYRSLDEAAELLDPAVFFRANRQFLVNTACLERFRSDTLGRILLYFPVNNQPEIAIAKDRAAAFRRDFT